MPTPDIQIPVVEALIRWLNPRWFVETVEEGKLDEKHGVFIYKEQFSFSGAVYYTLLIPLEEEDGDSWYSPNKIADSEGPEELRLNPFTDGNYQLRPATYKEFEDNREGIYLTHDTYDGRKVLWLPSCYLDNREDEAGLAGFGVDVGFENQRYEYWDSYPPEVDKPDIYFVEDLLGPKSRDLLNWEVVPETLLRRFSDVR